VGSPISKGMTYLVKGPVEPCPHLRIVISENKGGRVLVVNMTKGFRLPEGDDRCIIQPGEHSFVKTQTAILYSRAELVSISQISTGIRLGIMKQCESVSQALLKRIQDGALENDALPIECEGYFDHF
jgi:hypothetical protein